MNACGLCLSCLLVRNSMMSLKMKLIKLKYQNKFNIDDKGMINCIWKIYIEIKHGVTNEQQLDSYIKDYCGL